MPSLTLNYQVPQDGDPLPRWTWGVVERQPLHLIATADRVQTGVKITVKKAYPAWIVREGRQLLADHHTNLRYLMDFLRYGEHDEWKVRAGS